jgi:hypothetical protein
MPERHTLQRITLYVVGASVALTALAFILGGTRMGIGAVVGGTLGVLNWLAMRWVGERLLIANDKGRLVWGALLALKMAALLAITWTILSTGLVDPIGFTVGLSGLILGALAGAFHSAISGPASSSGDESSALTGGDAFKQEQG